MVDLTVHDRYSDAEIAAYYESGIWEETTLLGMVAQQAQTQPDKVFVFDSTTSLTYSQLHEDAIRIAAGLRRAGIQPGDRVVVQVPNFAEFATVMVAINRAGGVIVPIMPIYRGAEVSFIAAHSGGKAVITVGEVNKFNFVEMFRELRGELPALERIFVLRGEASDGVDTIESLRVDGELADLEAELGPDKSPDDAFLVVYTSGTTSRPKGCVHTVNTARTAAKSLRDGLQYTSADVQFGPSPVAHSTGMITSIMLPLLTGASSHFMEAWEPNAGMQRMIDHKITCAVTATPFLQMLLSVYDPAKHDVSSVRAWVCAGSPIPPAVVQRANQMFTNGTVLSLYGRSENYVTTMVDITDPGERSVTSDGRAVAGTEVRVVDPDGSEVPVGEEGDIAFRGPSHMLGYYRDPAETDALFTPDGFSRSGDLGRSDAEGFVRVTGRTKDIIIRGGMNISARELEDHLLHLDTISNVAAVGMPDERLGEKVCVYVIPADGATVTLEDVVALLKKEGVATQKLPERLEIVDALPMTATGKIQKHLLRADVAGKLRTAV